MAHLFWFNSFYILVCSFESCYEYLKKCLLYIKIDWIKWERLKWVYFSMRESVIYRSLSPSSPFLVYLNRIHPLYPIVVAHSMQPFVFSPQYAVSELADGLVHYLSRLQLFTILITTFIKGRMYCNNATTLWLSSIQWILWVVYWKMKTPGSNFLRWRYSSLCGRLHKHN